MLQHNVQHLKVSGKASVTTARKLIAAAQSPATITLASTVECNDYDRSITVVPCQSKRLQVKCGVTLVPDQLYYMVRSQKFHSRWYLLTKNVQSGAWMCSLRDVQSRCIAQIEQYLRRA